MSIVIRCYLLQDTARNLLISHLGFSLLFKNQPLNLLMKVPRGSQFFEL